MRIQGGDCVNLQKIENPKWKQNLQHPKYGLNVSNKQIGYVYTMEKPCNNLIFCCRNSYPFWSFDFIANLFCFLKTHIYRYYLKKNEFSYLNITLT